MAPLSALGNGGKPLSHPQPLPCKPRPELTVDMEFVGVSGLTVPKINQGIIDLLKPACHRCESRALFEGATGLEPATLA